MSQLTSDLNQVVDSLRKGEVVVIPTDTVWGLACSAESLSGIRKFYEIKKREAHKPTAILVGSFEQALEYGVFTDSAKELTSLHWPGALTVVVPATAKVPESIQGDHPAVGVRFPDFQIVAEITKLLGAGLVTGSANFAGEPSPMKKSELDPKLLTLVDKVLDGECGGQPPSTVVDCTKDELIVLRQGEVNV